MTYEPKQYWGRLLGGEFSLSGVGHPNLPDTFNRLLYRSLAASVDRIAQPLPPDAHVLDIGIGTGFWLEFWRRRGATLLAGIDLTEIAVANARERFPEGDFVVADIAALEPPFDRRFDLVSAMNVLLHVTEDEAFGRAVVNIRRLLKPGGLLVAIEPVVVHDWWGEPFDERSTSRARTVSEWREIMGARDLELLRLAPATCLLGNPVDTRSAASFALLTGLWFGVTRSFGESERRAALIGTPLAMLDRVLTRTLPAGPSAKCFVAKAVRTAT